MVLKMHTPKHYLSTGFSQCPSLLCGMYLFHNNHMQWISDQRREGKDLSNFVLVLHCAALLSCRVSRTQDNTAVPSSNLYAEQRLGEWG